MDHEQLVELLCTENKLRRREIVVELQAALPESRAAVLRGLREDPRPLVRASCADVLDDAEQDHEVEQLLREACRDRDARVRGSALHSLACVHCKPDGCVASDSVDVLLDALLNDPSLRLRRKMAGGFMHRQNGAGAKIVAAFNHILANDTDGVLRTRAAIFRANCELSSEDGRLTRELVERRAARVAELVSAGASP